MSNRTTSDIGVTGGPEVTLVVPTFNEKDNIATLINHVANVLRDIHWELIFVDDDSTDGTDQVIREFALKDCRVRSLERIGRRGLSSACIEGVLASASRYFAVMDADLQHDECLLPVMLETLKREKLDAVVGSRYVEGGSVGPLAKQRVELSKFGARLSRMICKIDIADPMSGFFMMKREAFDRAVRNLSGQGFKILLDLLASSPEPMRVKELPYEFRQRLFGASKLDTLVAWEFGVLLADKLLGHLVPVRFALFSFIGLIGLGVHLVVLRSALAIPGFDFSGAQAIATIVAMTSNFFLNNLLTYRDQRLRGLKLIRGLFSFYAVCAIGAVGNVGIATYLFAAEHVWWLAGIAGVLVGSVWNYAASSVFTWRPQRSV